MQELDSSMEVTELEAAGFDEAPKSSEAGPVESRLEELLAAVGALQEQFSEKIMVDAHKNALFDEMHQELTRWRSGLLDKIVEAMALDLIQLLDSTKRSYRAYEEREASEEHYAGLLRVVKGTAEELTEILYRQGIEAYQVAGEEVDVRRQKVLQTVATGDPAKDALVAVRVAEGYEKDGKTIRPERIKVYKYSPKENEEA